MSCPVTGGTVEETAAAIRAAGIQQPHTTAAIDREIWAPFERWCREVSRDALPATEDTLLAYLTAHPAWSWGYTKQIAVVVNRIHRRAGHPIPAGPRTHMLLKKIAREKGRVAQPLIDDFAADELLAMCRLHRGEVGGDRPEVLQLAAATVAAVLLQVPTRLDTPSLINFWDGVEVEFWPGELLLTSGQTQVLLRDTDEPFAAAVLRRASAPHAADHTRPPSDTIPRTALASAWHRAGFGKAPALLPADIDRDALAWLVANIEPSTPRRLRDVAYLLVGVFWALRHEDLAHLRMEHLNAVPEGYRIYVARSKADPDGRRPIRLLPHVSSPSGSCSELCPACALRDHLRAVAASGREDGYVFETVYAGERRAMTRQNGRLRILDMWEKTDPPHQKRIGTRSCRVTGATFAYNAGMPIDQIASEVTLHASLDEAVRYIRRQHSTEFQLSY